MSMVASYYDILGITPQSDQAVVRAAYKQLAKRYHPDRNPGDPEAEEMFKKINEAYHVLSDPRRRVSHDLLFASVAIEQEVLQQSRPRRPRYARPAAPYYRIDGQYFRMQGLSILVFLVLAGFCLALLNTVRIIVEKKHARLAAANALELRRAGMLFTEGAFEDALAMVTSLSQRQPAEFSMHATLDSLTRELGVIADRHFERNDYTTAVELYRVLARYKHSLPLERRERYAMSEYQTGHYVEALSIMKELFAQHPDSPELAYSIAVINLDKTQNINEASLYLGHAKKLLSRRFQSLVRQDKKGNAAVAQDPLAVNVLVASARCNLHLKNSAAAIDDCRMALRLDPVHTEALSLMHTAAGKEQSR